jgi:cysteinyl-tRNA synthetase
MGRRIEKFKPVNRNVVSIFTCGPSVYRRSHIGNFRTFLFEDIVVRYLEYLGYSVKRGITFTDVEDKAILNSKNSKKVLEAITQDNIKTFLREMKLLRMKIPYYKPRASETISEAVDIIQRLLDLKVAYHHNGNIYFNPLRYRGFGELYGLDMSKWPDRKKRFHRDTYTGMRWNLGDFIIWHGASNSGGDVFWNTKVGRGRPSWNIQDPGMVIKYFQETLSIYCGGVDNLIRHHDYSRAIFESIRPYPMAKYWLHCQHLMADGKKMSKSSGNIYYIEDLLAMGFNYREIRFFLIYTHYRKRQSYSKAEMEHKAGILRAFTGKVSTLEAIAGQTRVFGRDCYKRITRIFTESMDNDLDVGCAFDGLDRFLGVIDIRKCNPEMASGYLKAIREVDMVLKVIF